MRILTKLFEFVLIAAHAFNFLRDVALCSLCLPDCIPVIYILTLTKATYLNVTVLYKLYTNFLVLQALIQIKLPYFSIYNAQLMYNAHPKLFRHSF
jgi:hypothetical protein